MATWYCIMENSNRIVFFKASTHIILMGEWAEEPLSTLICSEAYGWG